VNLLDPIGAFFALLCTYYSVKANVKTWPLGIIASCIDAILYFKTGLYADMSTSVLYLIMFIYGWYIWLYGGPKKTNLEVSSAPVKSLSVLFIIMLIGVLIVSQLLIKFTDSQVPYWDAVTAVLSIGAQWLMCRKYIQTWFLWFIVDFMYVILYFNKNINWHSGLLVIYLCMAITGYIKWRGLLLPKVKFKTNN
jgi:nicotinamide mononucleotide transporter